MTNEHDRVGVFRRQLFQTIASDLRQPFVKQAPPASCMVNAPLNVPWKVFLRGLCERASVQNRFETLVHVADNFGVAFSSEVASCAQQLLEAAGLKPLEKSRFLTALATESCNADASHMDEDVFGHAGLGFDSDE